jgi:hypothetical protein
LATYYDRLYRAIGLATDSSVSDDPARLVAEIRTQGRDLYANPEQAFREQGRADIVLSSHILEHVPAVTALLDETARHLRPRIQIHITPYVDEARQNRSARSMIGREHPLGITGLFWDKYAERHGWKATRRRGGGDPGTLADELVAVPLGVFVPKTLADELVAVLELRPGVDTTAQVRLTDKP